MRRFLLGAALAALGAAATAEPIYIRAGRLIDVPGKAGDPLADVTVLKTVDFVMARGEVVKGP